MPPRKSLDIDAELAALQAKAEKLKADQKLMLGELVIETGIHKLLNGDQLRDALLRLCDQARASQPMQKGGRADAGDTFPRQPEAPAPKPNGQGHVAPQPARHQNADLLAGAAPDRAGHRPAAEDPGLDRAS